MCNLKATAFMLIKSKSGQSFGNLIVGLIVGCSLNGPRQILTIGKRRAGLTLYTVSLTKQAYAIFQDLKLGQPCLLKKEAADTIRLSFMNSWT